MSDEERHIAFIEAVIDNEDVASAPLTFFRLTGRQLATRLVPQFLQRASDTTDKLKRQRLLAVAAELASRNDIETQTYWRTYEQIAAEPDCENILTRLTFKAVDSAIFKYKEQQRQQKEEKDQKVADTVETVSPLISDLTAGRHAHHLACAAQGYFYKRHEGVKSSMAYVRSLTNTVITDALLAGWLHFVRAGFGEIEAQALGRTDGVWYIEAAAMAGLDWLISNEQSPRLPSTPIVIALAALKAAYLTNGDDARRRLETWALARLNVDPIEGAAQLAEYWLAALQAGGVRLEDFNRFLRTRCGGPAFYRSLVSIVHASPDLRPDLLCATLLVLLQNARPELSALVERALKDGDVVGTQRRIWRFVGLAVGARYGELLALYRGPEAEGLYEELGDELIGAAIKLDGFPTHEWNLITVTRLANTADPQDEHPSGQISESHYLSRRVAAAIDAMAVDSRSAAGKALSVLVANPQIGAWSSRVRHALAQQARLHRDATFRHPTPSIVLAALKDGPPVNARDLRAVVVEELRRFQREMHTTAPPAWKEYWNLDSHGAPTEPKVENACRNHLLGRLQDRLAKYRITAAVPEAQQGDETRADMLMLTGAGRKLPVEAKRHYHADVWTAASAQLQGYAADPGADGFGIYLVFWFGNSVAPTPARPSGDPGPTSAAEMEKMLISDLPRELRCLTDVIVLDIASPEAGNRGKPLQRRAPRSKKPRLSNPSDAGRS